MCHSPHCWSLGDALGRRFSHRAVVLLLVSVCTSTIGARISVVVPPSSEGLLGVCVSAAHPFLRQRGVRCAHRARPAAHGACAYVCHCIGAGAARRSTHRHFGAVESPAARIGTSNRSDAEIPHAKQNMEAATLHSAFLWESAQGNDADGWF